MRTLKLRRSGRPWGERKLSKITDLISVLNLGICDSKFHGGIRDLEAKRSQSTSLTLPFVIWLGNVGGIPETL